MIKLIIYFLLLILVTNSYSLNLASPLAPIPAGRLTVSASYDLDGITITNREIPSIINRIYATTTIALVQNFNLGIDLGISQIDVASDSTDISLFHGGYSFSGGANIKLSTPFVKDIFGIIGISKGTWFNSTEKSNGIRYYQGIDLTGTIGPIFHIPKFGYIAFGPKVHYIIGKNDASSNSYHNINNLRGWVAIEYFPKMNTDSKYLPFLTIEGAIGPDASFKNSRAVVVEFSAAITFGTVTPKFFGDTNQKDNWHP